MSLFGQIKMIVHLFKNLCLILIMVNSVYSIPLTSICDQDTNFRDASVCFKYYSCVRNENFNIWEFEEQICDESLYFEPTLNKCVSNDKLITKCSNIDAVHSERMSKELKYQNRQTKALEDDERKLMNDLSKDLNQNLDQNSANATDDSPLFKIENGIPLLRRRKPNVKQPNESDTKRRKNSRMTPKKKKNKKNWIAIFVRGCNSVSSYDEDYDQLDEQLEEDEDQNDELEKPSKDQDHKPKDENKEKNRPNLNENSNENQPKSKNCNCDENKNRSTTNEPDLKKDNSTTSSDLSATSTAKPPNSSNITSSNQNLSTPPSNTTYSPLSTVSTDNSISSTLNSSIGSSTLNSSISSSTPSSLISSSTTSTTIKSTNTPIRNPLNVVTRSSTIKSQLTTSKPQLLSTSKQKPASRIVFVPKVMKNPHNTNDSKINEKEALMRFLDELKKKRTLTKENEVQLTAMFKEKLEEKKRKPLNSNKPQFENSMPVATFESTPNRLESTNRAKSSSTEQEEKNKKIDKIRDELNITDLDSTVNNHVNNYYANLADQFNSTNLISRA